MARHEADREDLMRDATVLRRRVELRLPDEADQVVAGFREHGHLSIYFGSDPVYHFHAEGQLHRAFTDGLLYRTQGTTLARLRRERTETGTRLVRHDLSDSETDDFLERMHRRLEVLSRSLFEGTTNLVRQIPPDDERMPSDLSDAIQHILGTVNPLAPAPRGRRFRET